MAQEQNVAVNEAASAGHADRNVQIVPLDSTRRTQPIHPSIPEVKLPSNRIVDAPATSAGDGNGAGSSQQDPNPTTLNPITLQPFTVDELRLHNIESLLRQYSTPEAAKKALDDTATELRKLIDENDRKSKEIEREMEEKEKTREIERRVYAKKLGKDG